MDTQMNQPQFTQQQGLDAQQQIRDILVQENLPAEVLVEVGEWAQRVIQNPATFPEFQDWLRSRGLGDDDIPQEPDYQELASMVAMGNVAAGMVDETAQQPAADATAAAPVSPEQLGSIAAQGRQGDTMLAHVTPEEAQMLYQQGGSGTINPATGLPEFNIFEDLWKGLKKAVKYIAPIALPVIAIFAPALIPMIGTALGASAALAPVVGAAAIAGGVTALSGGNIKEILGSAALTGLGAYLAPVVGGYVGKVTGVTSPGILSAIGSATIAGGVTALRGGTVSQILTAAATGAAANYLGQIASDAIGSGGIVNARITQKPFDDAVFIAADAEQLVGQGLGRNQISEILRSTGAVAQVADAAAAAAVGGAAASKIASDLSNRFGASKSMYTNAASTGAENSVIGGANVRALENVQKSEDAMFAAVDARNLRAAGLSQSAIEQNLVAAGVAPPVASMAASEAMRGATLDAAAQSIVTAAQRAGVSIISDAAPTAGTTAPTRVLGEAPLSTTPAAPTAAQSSRQFDADFLAADAAQLRAQGLGQDQIQQTLQQSGATPQAAYVAASSARMGQNSTQIAQQLLRQPGDLMAPPPAQPITQQPAAPVAPESAPGMIETVTPGTGSSPVAEVVLTPAPTAPAEPAAPGFGNVTDAQFIAADAAQLAGQGLSAQDIMSNLIASGVNPNAAQFAATAALQGIPSEIVANQVTQAAQGQPLYGTPPTNISGSIPGGNVSEAEFVSADARQLADQFAASGAAPDQVRAAVEQNLVYAGVNPATAATAAGLAASGASQATILQTIAPAPGADSLFTSDPIPGTPGSPPAAPGYDVGAVVGGSVINSAAGDLSPVNQPPRRDMGTFTPAAPDPSWSIPLQYPGMNPGLMGAGIQPAYQTTSPVQSQYYWGRQPYMATPADMANYNQVTMPQQPWGIQQGYFEQPLALPQVPVYGENMFVLPQTDYSQVQQAATGQSMLGQGLPFAQPVIPPTMAPAVAPQMMQVPQMMPQQYVYNIAATPQQYTMPTPLPTV